MKTYRQGDVLIREVSKIPKGTKAVDKDAGRIILAYGEVTGHAHAIRDKGAQLMALGEQRFLKVTDEVTLRHEEHAPIPLPRGKYEIVIQREFTPEEIRNVAD